MSDPVPRPLHLVIGELSAEAKALLPADAEVAVLTEASAREVLDKIFAAESVKVWAEIKD